MGRCLGEEREGKGGWGLGAGESLIDWLRSGKRVRDGRELEREEKEAADAGFRNPRGGAGYDR